MADNDIIEAYEVEFDSIWGARDSVRVDKKGKRIIGKYFS